MAVKENLEELHRKAMKEYEAAQKKEEHNETEGRIDLAFAAGDQWPADVRADRESKRRPVHTTSLLPKYIRQVTGDIRQARQVIRVRGVDEHSDENKAKIFTGIIRHIESSSNAQMAYVWAAQCSATAGEGHWRIQTDYAEDDAFNQDILIRRIIDPYSVKWDANSTDPQHRDALHCFVTDRILKTVLEERYGKGSISEFDDKRPDVGYSKSNKTDDTLLIAEYWYIKKIEKEIALLPDGSVVDLDKVPEGVAPVQTRKTHSRKVFQCIMSEDRILEGPHEWAGRYIPIISIVGEEVYDGEKIVKKGLVRDAKDAQRSYNYARVAVTEAIGASPKAPWLVTGDMIKGLEDHWENANTGNPAYLVYNPDPSAPGGAPQRQQPAAIQSALLQEVVQSAEDIKATTGIYDAGLGARSNETSGKAILARQREGDIGTSHYADNLAAGLAWCGTILIDLIPRIYDGKRTVRIIGEDNVESKIPLNQPIALQNGEVAPALDLAVGKYDVVVDTGPSYTTKRQESAESMMAFIQAYPPAAPVIGDLMAKAQDWQNADVISERLKKLLPPGIAEDSQPQPPPGPPPPPPPSPKEMAEVERIKEETESKRLDNAKKAFELGQLNGHLESFVQQIVQQNLQQIMGDLQSQMQTPAQPALPMPGQDSTGGLPMPGLDPSLQ